MNIIHAGGKINNKHYSNSFESIIHNININKNIDITIELDILKIKDNFIIAHNGLEHIYGYNGNFKNILFDDFNLLKIYKKYTPMNFYLLKDIIETNPNVKFNLDIKESKYNYIDVLNYIKNIFGNNLNNLIPQVYELNDLLECLKFGFNSCMIGMWKYHDDVFSQSSFDFINNIQKYNTDINITGFSVDYKHTENPNFKIIKHMIKSPIYLHNGDKHIDNDIINEFNTNGIWFFL